MEKLLKRATPVQSLVAKYKVDGTGVRVAFDVVCPGQYRIGTVWPGKINAKLDVDELTGHEPAYVAISAPVESSR